MHKTSLLVEKVPGIINRLRRAMLRMKISEASYIKIQADCENILAMSDKEWLGLGRGCETVKEVLNKWGYTWEYFCDICGAKTVNYACPNCEPARCVKNGIEMDDYRKSLWVRARARV